ncbi:TorF family putative porin [Acinetobacter larvae]|uniref:Porin n=1 Tax=Acinetobacter larvae TaxID=1789224 RepID=A0A1B2M3D3_9GAMM|nr:TorF family putative porin [Acinetobacter larvae]AOA59684.1 hypothetical protein BFG52_15895 [Acinetobacter larvae]
MKKLGILIGALAVMSPMFAYAHSDSAEQTTQPQQAQPSQDDQFQVSGWIGAVSAYVSRGGTKSPENDDTVIQGYLNGSYKGLYAAYWVSKLGYSFAETQEKQNIDNNNALTALQKAEAKSNVSRSAADFYEHDFFVGYANKYNDLSYDLQVATYLYPGSKNSTGVEAGVFLNHPVNKDIGNAVSLSVQSYLNDTIYMNQGDTYVELGYEHPLPKGFTANLSSGFSWFQDNGKYEGGKNGGLINTTEDFVFRHATVQLTHDLFNNPQATGWLKYIVGGENRSGENQKNMVVAGVRYAF